MVYRTSKGDIGSLDYREMAPLSSMKTCIWIIMEKQYKI